MTPILPTSAMNLTRYLPFEHYVLTTNLSMEEVYQRLSENIQSRKPFRLSLSGSHPTKPYEGEISMHSFRISRIIHYRNSFLPLIRGEVSTFSGQTQIQIRMRPVMFVLIFISFWLGIVGIMCLGILLAGLLNIKQVLQNGFSPAVLIPFGMFLFGCLLANLAFKAESKKSKYFLATLLNGQENS